MADPSARLITCTRGVMHSVFFLWCLGALLGNEMVKQENILCMFVFVFFLFFHRNEAVAAAQKMT